MMTQRTCRRIKKRITLDHQSADVDAVAKTNRKVEYNADGAIDSLVQNVALPQLTQIPVTSAQKNGIEKVKQRRNQDYANCA